MRVGSTFGPLASHLARIVADVLGAIPDIRMGLDGRTPLAMLTSGDIDAAIALDYPGTRPADPDLQRHLIAVEPVFVGVPATHYLARRTEIELAELATETYSGPRDPASGLTRHVITECERVGYTPRLADLDHADLCTVARRPHTVLLMKPSSQPPAGLVAVPLAGTPLRMDTRLYVSARTALTPEAVRQLRTELVIAQHSLVEATDVYRAWLERHPEWDTTPVDP
ncbi:LysR substrate-binding domain-containing protein [Pilimelia anulata]